MDRIVLQLMNTIMDYDRFCHVASDLEWIDVEMRHEDWYLHRDPIGIYLDVFTFPDTYIRNHFPEAYVRAVLSSMAFYEEWDKDFWNIPKIQRIACLTQGRALYENYVIRRERRLLMRDWEYLEREIRFFADRNGVPESKQTEIFDQFNNAIVIETGGDYSGDYEYLAIKDDMLMLVSCGCWD